MNYLMMIVVIISPFLYYVLEEGSWDSNRRLANKRSIYL